MGQHLQRHILKRTGGAVPQLKAVGGVVHFAQRGNSRRIELVRAIGALGKAAELFLGEAIQIEAHHIGRPLLIGHIFQFIHCASRKLGNGFGNEQAAVPGEPLGDRLSGGESKCFVSCAQIVHTALTVLIRLLK